MPLLRSVQSVYDGQKHWKRTITVTPLSDSKLRYTRIRSLDDFKNGRELTKMILDTVLAHEGYYKAGVLHGNICLETIMIQEDYAGNRNGVLIDMDQADSFARPQRPPPAPSTSDAETSDKGKEREH